MADRGMDVLFRPGQGIWDVENGQLLKLLEGHEAAVLRVDVNPSGTLIALIS
jgi:hypothetical protein